MEVDMIDLTEEQRSELETRLQELRRELEERLASTAAQVKPVDLGLPIGRLSRVDAMQAQELARSQRRRDEVQLQLTKAALSRLRQGIYGECIRCEEPIGFERLAASPEVALCRACKESAERR
jgi:DnaK suppressor protein